MSRYNYKKLFLLIVLVLITVMVMKVTALNRGQLTPLEAAVKDIIAPLQQVTMTISRGLKGAVSFFASLGDQARENQELRAEIEVLNSELRRVEEHRVENRRLKELLEFKEFNIERYQLMTAVVIGRDPGNWFGTITVNRGLRDGVQRDMAVLVPVGLVGRVVAVSEHTAEVLLITDPRSGVGALVQQNRVPGVVEGVANRTGVLRMIHIPKDAPVRRDQVVVSSGVGAIYPRGIGVGEVISIEDDPSGLFQIALIDPFVNFRRLEEVLIVTTVYTPELNLPLEDTDNVLEAAD